MLEDSSQPVSRRRELLQLDPAPVALDAQGVLHRRRGAQPAEPAHRDLGTPLLRAGAARVPAAPRLQRARLPQPRLFPARPQDARARKRALRHLLRRVLRRLGIQLELGRADRGPLFLPHRHRERLRRQARPAARQGAGAGLPHAAARLSRGFHACGAPALPRKQTRPQARIFSRCFSPRG